MATTVSDLSARRYLGALFGHTIFKSLVDAVNKSLQNAPPGRQFYITGHSLGGGVAKLVGAIFKIQAVTFASPGIGTTSYSLFGWQAASWAAQRQTAITVMPKYDLASLIDWHIGVSLDVDCYGSPIHCHRIMPLVCRLLTSCGSGRTGDWSNLTLPMIDSDGNSHCTAYDMSGRKDLQDQGHDGDPSSIAHLVGNSLAVMPGPSTLRGGMVWL